MSAVSICRQATAANPTLESWVDNVVFTNELGRTIEPSILNRHLTRILKAVGLPDCHVHDLCHNCASFLHAAGADLKTISELLGHSTSRSWRIFTRTCSHRSSEMRSARLLECSRPGRFMLSIGAVRGSDVQTKSYSPVVGSLTENLMLTVTS